MRVVPRPVLNGCCSRTSRGEPLKCHCFLRLEQKAWLTLCTAWVIRCLGNVGGRSDSTSRGTWVSYYNRAPGGGVHQFVRKQNTVRLCTLGPWRGSHWLWPTWLPSPHGSKHVSFLASSPWETPGFLLTCPSSLMEPFVGRRCYPWRDGIFGNRRLEWTGQYFFCDQGASLIYFFMKPFMEYRVVMAKIPREEGWGRSHPVALGKLVPSETASSAYPRNLPCDPAQPLFGEETALCISSRDANCFGGCSERWLKPQSKGEGGQEAVKFCRKPHSQSLSKPKLMFPLTITQNHWAGVVQITHFSETAQLQLIKPCYMRALSNSEARSTSLFTSVVKTKRQEEKKTLSSQGSAQ